jgi:hypothetical protein
VCVPEFAHDARMESAASIPDPIESVSSTIESTELARLTRHGQCNKMIVQN